VASLARVREFGLPVLLLGAEVSGAGVTADLTPADGPNADGYTALTVTFGG